MPQILCMSAPPQQKGAAKAARRRGAGGSSGRRGCLHILCAWPQPPFGLLNSKHMVAAIALPLE